jgi:hypothetical protein
VVASDEGDRTPAMLPRRARVARFVNVQQVKPALPTGVPMQCRNGDRCCKRPGHDFAGAYQIGEV